MAKRRKLWSVVRITDPRFPACMIRITELSRGGNLYAVRMLGGSQRMTSLKITRADLGVTDKEQEAAARALALNIIAELASGKVVEGKRGQGSNTSEASAIGRTTVLSLGVLVDLYEQRGSLTAQPRYKLEQVAKVRRIVAFLGEDRPVVSLSRSDVDRWLQHRLDGEGRPVRRNTISGEIAALKIALNWAMTENRADGRPLLEVNPVERVRARREEPRRPVADSSRFHALETAAASLDPLFGLALALAVGTGHRIGAILALQWQHILFDPAAAAVKASELDSAFGWSVNEFHHSETGAPLGGIHWYAGRRTNNKAAPHVTPITVAVREALELAQRERPAIGGAWLFPSPRDGTKSLDRYVLNRWLREAERIAELPHLSGSAWHAFRRGWATKHKHAPDVDVAKLGGWRDLATMKKCYTHADVRTIREIVCNG